MVLKLRFPRNSYPIPIEEYKGYQSSYGWWPGSPTNILPRFTKSSVGASNFCPQQYFIKYPLGVKEPENDNMIRGTNVHDAVEQFYHDVDLDVIDELNGVGNDLHEMHNYFMSIIPNMDRYELGEEEHIRKYLLAEAMRAMDCDLDLFLPVGNEITLHGVVEIQDQKIHITGMIDRLFVDNEGRYHVHELKTGVFNPKKDRKWEHMRQELAYYVFLMKHCDNKLYDRDNNVIGELPLSDANVAWWGWDHTGGEGIYRGKESVRTREMALMLRSLEDLLRYHRNYNGDTDGIQFPLLHPNKTNFLCEPWCALKGFCPRYDKPLMPYNARVFKSESLSEGGESG